MKKSLTIHDIEDTLEKLIRERANTLNQSLDKTVKNLLRDSLGTETGIKRADRRRKEFTDLFGAWTPADIEEFFRAIGSLNAVRASD
jgi:hypothetical protein